MKLIADANVWYDIGNGRIAPEQFGVYGEGLFATPTSLLEVASGINERSFDERKRAAVSVIKYAAGVTEDTETHLAHVWKVRTQSVPISWMDGFKAIALAESVEELENGVADFELRIIRRVGVSVVHEWREKHWNGFQQEIVTALDDWIPGYRNARSEGKYKRIAKDNRSAFKEAMRSREVKATLALATYERVRLAAPSLPNPSKELISEAEGILAPYIDAYSEYVIRCATEMAPQANDFGDCESFIYLQSGNSLVTSDDRWIRIAQAVCPSQIIVPVIN
jgi:hypothetical protein